MSYEFEKNIPKQIKKNIMEILAYFYILRLSELFLLIMNVFLDFYAQKLQL